MQTVRINPRSVKDVAGLKCKGCSACTGLTPRPLPNLNPFAVICTNLHLITPQNENTRLAAEHFCPGHLMWSAAMCSSAVNPLYTITGRGSAFGFEEGNRLVVCGRSAPRRTQGSSPNENGPGSCRAERASGCGVSLAEAFRFAKPVSI